ncbi:hypothetical protein ISF_09732 [Cordyceps fumosorosea ARSEF 2679]|uniref:Uncharacterized protein n=1 Tax=Cordyceps fumosorosea (strain ARSEF 2679) TaxID=1081104 RepID=A0A167DEQ8_CORFA|nr:hypothetical protein ISF_09732 [Cordyceps fumosorosea ARSEF 2679]OAA42292.1 hypothetical protein ISF_09732 [Cordyceps fumosorosea ARSEF 2679]
MAKDLSFQRQVRQLRNLVNEKGAGHEQVTPEHQQLLESLGDVPEPAKDEPRLLQLFSLPAKFDPWLKKWAEEAALRVAENTSKEAGTDATEASSSNGAKQQKSILEKATTYFLGGSKDDHGEISAQSITSQPATPQLVRPATSQATSAPATPSQPTAAHPAAPQPATPQPTANKPAESSPAASSPAESLPAESSPAESSPAPQPTAAQPAAPQPGTPQPTANKPAASSPAQSSPAAPQPTAAQPVAPQPATPQPTANEPAAAQPAASQPTASQPAASQPTASQPAAAQPHTPRPAPARPATATQTTASTAAFFGYRAPTVTNAGSEPTSPRSLDDLLRYFYADSPTAENSHRRTGSSLSSAGTRPHRDPSPSRSGAAAAQGHYTPPTTPRREDDGTDQNQEDDGSTFDPGDWEANRVDEAGYVIRPPCFSSYPNTMPSRQRFPELWYEVADTIDGKMKWCLLKGKVRKNSLAFEVPSNQGSRFMLFPPGPYTYVSQMYHQKTGRQVPEVNYGNRAHIVGRDLARNPPHQLCFSLAKGLQRKGDTFLIWYDDDLDETWFTKSEVKECVGAAALNAFLKTQVPTWNLARDRPGGEPSPTGPLSPSPTPTQAPIPPPQRQVHWTQGPGGRRAGRQTPVGEPQANTATPNLLSQGAPSSLRPIYEGHPAGDEAPPAWYNPPGHLNGAAPQGPGLAWQPWQLQQPTSTSQVPSAPGQAPLAQWPYTFAYPQNPTNPEQPVHGVVPWLPWLPPYSQGYPQPPVSQVQMVPGGPPPYEAGNRGYRGSSHLPTPPRQMEYERPWPNGSRQASEQPNPRTANNPTSRRGPSTSPWW